MIDLSNRSYKEELLDQHGIPFADIQQNMKELDNVNSLLGGHAITIKGVEQIIQQHPINKKLIICEIGCGGGDNLLAISNWCRKKNIAVAFIGIDIKKECIEYAQQKCASLDATWINSDYALANFGDDKPDIIFSSLFCHHFKNDALPQMLNWMKFNSRKGFFINDLQRNRVAYYAIKVLTGIFSNSYLVKNDAPLSVARGFIYNEWVSILEDASIKKYTLHWQWAFRYLIIFCHD